MLVAHAQLETRLLLRNGEQLLLTLVIPALLLAVLSTVEVVDVGTDDRVDFLAPGVLALAVMSTAFTGLAIATGYERRYGVLKRLGSTPLPRWVLLSGKIASILVVEALQVAVLYAIGYALGWRPHGSPLAVAALLLAGTAAFGGLGLLMAGTLRAEVTLAAANLVWVLLLLGGGVIVPLDRFPDRVASVLQVLPITALSDGLRAVLLDGAGLPWAELAILLAWAAGAIALAATTFRWSD